MHWKLGRSDSLHAAQGQDSNANSGWHLDKLISCKMRQLCYVYLVTRGFHPMIVGQRCMLFSHLDLARLRDAVLSCVAPSLLSSGVLCSVCFASTSRVRLPSVKSTCDIGRRWGFLMYSGTSASACSLLPPVATSIALCPASLSWFSSM